jgi:hypothetical protein
MISRPLYSTMSLLMMRSLREPRPLDATGLPPSTGPSTLR